jgi:hypothetical protein
MIKAKFNFFNQNDLAYQRANSHAVKKMRDSF